jgi:hypothetical protein
MNWRQIAGTGASMTENDPGVPSEDLPTTPLENRDSTTRRARCFTVESPSFPSLREWFEGEPAIREANVLTWEAHLRQRLFLWHAWYLGRRVKFTSDHQRKNMRICGIG